jgi:hypothetical protein
MRVHVTMLGLCCLAASGQLVARRQSPPPEPLAVWLHAHNCYPDRGVGVDRLDRALRAARGTIAIEQDLVWDARRGQSVVSHEPTLAGNEPTLEDHFFVRVAPMLDGALAEDDRRSWPRHVLHLDFKTNEPAHHAAVWALLGRYERWLTTAPRGTSDAVQPLTRGPLLVLTEQGDGQERAFYDVLPVGARLRVFGTVPGPLPDDRLSGDARLDAAFSAPVEALIPTTATNYRRWTNHSWAVVERGGQAGAGEWTSGDRARLNALVGRAHDFGLWIRFYTLNGHAPNGEGWSAGYNFGSLTAVVPRWRAAVAAGVEFIATDQYDAFSEVRRVGRGQ